MKRVTTKVRHLLEMIRFSHTVFALPFALLSALIAWTTPTLRGETVMFRWQDLIGILLCMVTARSAAMAFNRLADRDIDAQNPRTQTRHLPSGVLSVSSVVVFTIWCSATFIACTLFFLPNTLPLILSVPVLGVLFVYSYTKRFSNLAHFWLGLSLMLAPVAAWIAIRGSLVIENPVDLAPALGLGLAVLFWVAGFDIIYACQDYEFDRKAKLKSVPAKFGIDRALWIAAVCHSVMILLLLLMPYVSAQLGLDVGMGWIYYTGVLAIAGLLIYEHWIVQPNGLTKVNIAFFNVNAIVSFGLFVIAAIDVFV